MTKDVGELLPFYALDSLTEEEKVLVEAYVAANPDAQQQLAELQEAVLLLAQEAAPLMPAPRVKETLMARVHAQHPSPQAVPVSARPAAPSPNPVMNWWQRLRRPWLSPALTGLSLVLAVAVAVWGLTVSRQLDAARERLAQLATREAMAATNAAALESELAGLREQNAALERELRSQNEQLAALLSGQVITVSGTAVQPAASGTLLVSAAGDSAVFIASGLQPLEEAVYQLWLIGDSGPVSAGTFQVDSEGQGMLQLELETAIAELDAVGVSVEPEGGSLAPSGDIVLLGERNS